MTQPTRQRTIYTNRKANKEAFQAILATSLVIVFLFAVGGALSWISASNEAAAFNRLTTGPKVTTWDAFWLDLRVEAQR